MSQPLFLAQSRRRSLLKCFRPHTCGICHGGFGDLFDEVVVLYCENYPLGSWEMAVIATMGMMVNGQYLYDCESPCVKVHEHCYRFISALKSPRKAKKGPDFVGRVVSSFMVGEDNLDARIPEPLSEKRSGSAKYIIADRRRVQALKIEIYFQDGLAWLATRTYARLAMWDTPTPPKILHFGAHSNLFQLESCAMSWPSNRYPSHPKTIDLSTCTGLTFLYKEFSREDVFAIQVHTRTSPVHLKKRPDGLTAVYVPLPPGEEILSMSVLCGEYGDEGSFSLMFETKLAGVFHVGYHQRLASESHSKSPKALIYFKGTSSHQPAISVYPMGEGSLPHTFRWPGQNGHLGCTGMLYSWAPLKNMARVDVYHDEDNLLGMHLYYENGAQRTVGECRVGSQPYRSWSKPSALYWRLLTRTHQVQVVFDDRPTGGNSEKEWNRADLVGEMHMLASGYRQYFEVLPAGSWRGV